MIPAGRVGRRLWTPALMRRRIGALRWPWLGTLSAVTGRRIHAILVHGARIMTGQNELMTDETCSCIGKLLHNVTPMIFREFTRWIPGMMGTSVVPRERGFLNIISWDFDLFSDNLFSLANCCMCSSSRSRVWALDAGMTKLESYANLNISFPAVFGRRSDPVTMYANGPRPEPWMTLTIIALKADSTSLNFQYSSIELSLWHDMNYYEHWTWTINRARKG